MATRTFEDVVRAANKRGWRIMDCFQFRQGDDDTILSRVVFWKQVQQNGRRGSVSEAAESDDLLEAAEAAYSKLVEADKKLGVGEYQLLTQSQRERLMRSIQDLWVAISINASVRRQMLGEQNAGTGSDVGEEDTL